MAEQGKAPEVKPEVKAATPPVAPPKPKAPEAQAPKANVLKEDSWMYHKEFEPKLFKKGEEHPDASWSHKNTFGWYRDQKNNFAWRKK